MTANLSNYYDSKETAKILGVKPSSLYRLKGISQVRTTNAAHERQVYKYFHKGDVHKLVEWRQSEEFHRKAKENKRKAGQAPTTRNRTQQPPPVVTKSGVELKRAQTNDGRQYLVAPALYDVPEPWQWTKF
jgi:hypothetical protein